MDEPSLDHLLQRYRQRPRPSLPSNFQQHVWREIRQRKAATAEPRFSLLSWFADALLQPQTVLASATLAIALGIGIGTQELHSRTVSTSQALDLQVFSDTSPGLPSTLLSAKL